MFVVLSVSRRLAFVDLPGFTDVRFAPMIGQIISHYQRIMEDTTSASWKKFGSAGKNTDRLLVRLNAPIS